jgi:hypothetical protein
VGRHLRYGLLLGLALALFYVPSAWADTYTVDNTGDTDLQACTVAAGDCSLRSAVTAANNHSGTDDIGFDSTVFDGGATSTITSSGNVVISGAVTITGGNCGTTNAPKPCVGFDTNGSIGLNVFTNGAVSISGMAFTGSPGSAINANGVNGPAVTGSWFGVGLDGATLSGNSTGIALVNSNGAVIGGNTAATRNVFASNSTGIVVGGSGGTHVIKGNYFGTLPSGTAVSGPGTVGIDMTGSNSGETIGGDSTTAGQCDGECNLIVGFGQDGIRVGFAGAAPTGVTISGNFIGLGLNGTSNLGNGTSVNKGSGIDLDQAQNVTIGGTANTKRNYIAGNTDGGVRATQASNMTATNNYIGLNAAGTAAIPNTTTDPNLSGGLADLAGTGGTISGNRFGGNGLMVGASMNVFGNVIGIGTGGQDLGIPVTVSEPGMELTGGSNTIGGQNPGEPNTIGNVKSGAAAMLLINGSGNNVIQGNFIGTTSTGTPEPNAGKGILLGGSNLFGSNTIGGSVPTAENVISNNGQDAIAMPLAGGPTQVLRNVGKNNGSSAGDLFFDLGTPGLGNLGGGAPNNSIQAPAGLSTTSTTLSGTGDDGDAIFAYATYTSHGDIRAFLGSTVVASGTWSITFPSLPAGQCVTANQTDGSNNSSEMATAVAVGGGSCVLHPTTEIAAGPAEGTSTTDPTPTFGFSSPDSGVAGFECKVDGDAFSPCSGGFTPSTDLSDGLHTFTVRGHQTPSNPGLGPDVGAPLIRTFTVDTTGPVISFTSGPGEGATIDTSSTALGFSANEASTFVCKLDGGTFGSCHSPFSVSSLGEGTHTVRVRGTDNLGNVGAVATRSFNLTFPIATPPVPTPTPTPTKKKCKKKAKKGQASAAKKCKKHKKK